MGGGKMTRPDFGLGQPDPGHPMTEFYTLLLEGLSGAETFGLPGLYARFDPPAWPIAPEEARDWVSLSPTPREGFVRLLDPGRLRVLYAELRCTPAGVPSALMLTQEGSRSTCGVRLLPPFLWPSDEAAPPWPDCSMALTLALGPDAPDLADASPRTLARRLIDQTHSKTWVSHPLLDRWVQAQAARWQKLWR
ncbi:hypothetical protein B5G12_08425 [Faecalibacterium sp. An58]|uniref:hypothetical protein n=1 Tax=Faecalibacterium sp. An58 TaxID=1965648 RepID=UPI000B3A206A|nr:hypothetical protein [Faecalibacterium sp. An58]OUN72728.1 hypothetical protein B5G12_08425 [Faecalibacterium sp. An58]